MLRRYVEGKEDAGERRRGGRAVIIGDFRRVGSVWKRRALEEGMNRMGFVER